MFNKISFDRQLSILIAFIPMRSITTKNQRIKVGGPEALIKKCASFVLDV